MEEGLLFLLLVAVPTLHWLFCRYVLRCTCTPRFEVNHGGDKGYWQHEPDCPGRNR